eukprot:7235833-Pyramimonas_sp.AAC.1
MSTSSSCTGPPGRESNCAGKSGCRGASRRGHAPRPRPILSDGVRKKTARALARSPGLYLNDISH